MKTAGPAAGPIRAPGYVLEDAPAGTRDRILAAATELFARRGIRGVGVDAIVTKAGVAKASFYHHFPSKDVLIDEWLRTDDARWLDRVVVEAERRSGPDDDELGVFFEVLGELADDPDGSGCPFLNTAAELREPGELPRPVVLEFADDVRRRLERLARAAGLRAPEDVARQLQMVIWGAFATSVVRQGPPSQTLRAAADAIIRSARNV